MAKVQQRAVEPQTDSVNSNDVITVYATNQWYIVLDWDNHKRIIIRRDSCPFNTP
jgi:hypothetical protein